MTAILMGKLFPIVNSNVFFPLLALFVYTRFWKFVIFRKVPTKYTLENGEISLVTGSSCGIGCEIARQLGNRGWAI
uniref:Uncharacterized protein n=1 Tax=Romanomermis culicivorax TaxID=13658 RepID=A0A915KQP6_ROMCU